MPDHLTGPGSVTVDRSSSAHVPGHCAWHCTELFFGRWYLLHSFMLLVRHWTGKMTATTTNPSQTNTATAKTGRVAPLPRSHVVAVVTKRKQVYGVSASAGGAGVCGSGSGNGRTRRYRAQPSTAGCAGPTVRRRRRQQLLEQTAAGADVTAVITAVYRRRRGRSTGTRLTQSWATSSCGSRKHVRRRGRCQRGGFNLIVPRRLGHEWQAGTGGSAAGTTGRRRCSGDVLGEGREQIGRRRRYDGGGARGVGGWHCRCHSCPSSNGVDIHQTPSIKVSVNQRVRT